MYVQIFWIGISQNASNTRDQFVPLYVICEGPEYLAVFLIETDKPKYVHVQKIGTEIPHNMRK